MKKLNKKGFTIVELVIVIAVIGILSAVLIPTFSNLTDKANQSAAEQAVTNEYKEWLVDNAAYEWPSTPEIYVSNGNYLFKYDGSKFTVVAEKANDGFAGYQTANSNPFNGLVTGAGEYFTAEGGFAIYTANPSTQG